MEKLLKTLNLKRFQRISVKSLAVIQISGVMSGFLVINSPNTRNFAPLAIKGQLAYAVDTIEVKQVENQSADAKSIAPTQKKYVVQNNDNITKIARKFQIIERQIKDANNLESSQDIHAGQEISIPDAVLPSYEGVASWYGPGFDGRPMANGKIYDQNKILAAHRTLPLGSKVKITNLANGKTIITPIWDRGPYIYKNGEHVRDIDLSYAAAKEIGMVGAGLAHVKIETQFNEEVNVKTVQSVASRQDLACLQR